MNTLRNFSVNDLKKARDVGKNKFSETRDRFQSQPSKNLDVDPKNKPPPPPPARSSNAPSHDRTPSNLSRSSLSSPSPPRYSPGPPPRPPARAPSSGAPPIVRRTTRPDDDSSPNNSQISLPVSLGRSSSTASNQQNIDWTNLSQEDKIAFFALLDEYFESRRGTLPSKNRPERNNSPPVKYAEDPTATPSPPPPPLATWSRPKQGSSPNLSSTHEFTLSYPPPTQYGSAALDLAHYFSPETHWDSAWFKSSDAHPPPLQDTPIPGFMSSWETRGTRKTIFSGIIFADLSLCWYSVSFSTTSNADPNDARAVQREARYLPSPSPMGGPALVEAHETYGETVAGFAESYEGTGEYCARGECWDLASEALKYFDQFDYVPKPVPSTSCTHGHLIFSGKATSRHDQVGRWRGGDDRVRRGDILQWRSAKVDFGRGAHATLGDPEHTAVIVAEAVPSEQVEDGMFVKPGVIGVLEVVEQSVGSPPKRQTYDLAQMIEGEVWIYRPVGMVEYVGTVLEPRCPEGVNALSV